MMNRRMEVDQDINNNLNGEGGLGSPEGRKGGKIKEKETKEGKDDGSKEGSRRMENLR